VIHGLRFLVSRNRTVTLSEHGNAIKYDTDYLRLNRAQSQHGGPGTTEILQSSEGSVGSLKLWFRAGLMFVSKTP